MKKKYLSLFVLSFLFLIVSCQFNFDEIKRNVELVKIEVDTSNAKTVFDVHTDFSFDGLIVYGYNSDGSKFVIENDYCKIDSGEYDKEETHEGYEIKVSYSGLFTSYFVDVIDTRVIELEIYQKPLSVYEKLTSKEDLNLDDMIIKVMYANKSYAFWCSENYNMEAFEDENVKYITEVNGHTIYDFTHVYGINEDGSYRSADVPVEIYYDNLSVTLSLFVPLSPVSNIEVLGTLNKTNYKPGESISLDGLSLFVTYTNSSIPIPSNLNILQIIEMEVDPEEKEKKQYTQPIKLKFGEMEISFTKDNDKEVPLSIIRVIDDIIGIEIKPGETAPAYYYQNEDIEITDFLNNYDVFLKFESGDTSDIPLSDTERESVKFDNFSFDEVGVFPLKAAYEFYNKKNELVKATAYYNIMVTDSILLSISATHNKKTDLSNKEGVDFPEGVIPDNNPDYGEWKISGHMSNSDIIDIDSKFCSFAYKKDEYGNEIKTNNGEKIVIINYFDSRYRKDNSPSEYGKTFECEKNVTIGAARLLNVYSTKQEFSVLSGSKINLNDIKICLLGHYTGKQNYEQLISADRDLIKFYGQNNNLIESDITIDSNKTLYVQIQDRYDLSKKLSVQIAVNVIVPQISGIKMEPTDDKVIYITSDPKDFESLNSKPENIIIDENDLKNKFNIEIEENNNWILLEGTELSNVKVHYVPEGNYEFYQPVDCRVYATYEKDGKKFTTSYYADDKIILVPPRVREIFVFYSDEYPSIYDYEVTENDEIRYYNNKHDVIDNAQFEVIFTNGKREIFSVKEGEAKHYPELNRINVVVDYLDLYTESNNWELVNENLGNRHKFKLVQNKMNGYANTIEFQNDYELKVDTSISDIEVKKRNNQKAKFRLGKEYNSADIIQQFDITIIHRNEIPCKDKDIVECSLDLSKKILTITVEDEFNELMYFSEEIDVSSMIDILPPAIIEVKSETDIKYDGYFNDSNLNFILYFEDGTFTNINKGSPGDFEINTKQEDQSEYIIKYKNGIWGGDTESNVAITTKINLLNPIITNLNLTLQEGKHFEDGINVSNWERYKCRMDEIFDIKLTCLDGKSYVYDWGEQKIHRDGDTEKRRSVSLDFEYKKFDDQIKIFAYFKDDYENSTYWVSDNIPEFIPITEVNYINAGEVLNRINESPIKETVNGLIGERKFIVKNDNEVIGENFLNTYLETDGTNAGLEIVSDDAGIIKVKQTNTDLFNTENIFEFVIVSNFVYKIEIEGDNQLKLYRINQNEPELIYVTNNENGQYVYQQTIIVGDQTESHSFTINKNQE